MRRRLDFGLPIGAQPRYLTARKVAESAESRFWRKSRVVGYRPFWRRADSPTYLANLAKYPSWVTRYACGNRTIMHTDSSTSVTYAALHKTLSVIGLSTL